MLVAIAHLFGALLAMIALGVVTLLVATWESKRNTKVEWVEIATRLGVAVESLEDESMTPRVIELISERFSNDRISNRFSDLCGILRTMWSWFGSLLQIATFLGVTWYTITESLSNAVFAWWIFGLGLFFWVIGILFSLSCRFLTGRYPGQAKQVRKAMAAFLRTQRQQSFPPST